jgi:hypothetical protein
MTKRRVRRVVQLQVRDRNAPIPDPLVFDSVVANVRRKRLAPTTQWRYEAAVRRVVRDLSGLMGRDPAGLRVSELAPELWDRFAAVRKQRGELWYLKEAAVIWRKATGTSVRIGKAAQLNPGIGHPALTDQEVRTIDELTLAAIEDTRDRLAVGRDMIKAAPRDYSRLTSPEATLGYFMHELKGNPPRYKEARREHVAFHAAARRFFGTPYQTYAMCYPTIDDEVAYQLRILLLGGMNLYPLLHLRTSSFVNSVDGSCALVLAKGRAGGDYLWVPHTPQTGIEVHELGQEFLRLNSGLRAKLAQADQDRVWVSMTFNGKPPIHFPHPITGAYAFWASMNRWLAAHRVEPGTRRGLCTRLRQYSARREYEAAGGNFDGLQAASWQLGHRKWPSLAAYYRTLVGQRTIVDTMDKVCQSLVTRSARHGFRIHVRVR